MRYKVNVLELFLLRYLPLSQLYLLYSRQFALRVPREAYGDAIRATNYKAMTQLYVFINRRLRRSFILYAVFG